MAVEDGSPQSHTVKNMVGGVASPTADTPMTDDDQTFDTPTDSSMTRPSLADTPNTAIDLNTNSAGEDVEQSQAGFYLNLAPGNLFCKQFLILHELGFDVTAQHWLVRDVNNAKYLMLKACNTFWGTPNTLLTPILKKIEASTPLVHTLLAFPERYGHFPGQHGHHSLSFSSLMAPNLVQLQSAMRRSAIDKHFLRPGTIQRLSYTITQAVAHLHHLNIVHNNLTASNIIFMVPNLALMEPKRLVNILKITELEKNNRYNKAAGHQHGSEFMIQPERMAEVMRLWTGHVRLNCYDSLYMKGGDKANSLWSPMYYWPPEALIVPRMTMGFPGTEASDIWALGHLIFELRFGVPLYPPDTNDMDPGSIMAAMVATFGPAPSVFKELDKTLADPKNDTSALIGENCNLKFLIDTLGSDPKPVGLGIPPPLEGQVPYVSSGPLSRMEARYLWDLLRRIFVYDEQRRLSAAEVLSHNWFTMRFV